jgi:hypothetical protein
MEDKMYGSFGSRRYFSKIPNQVWLMLAIALSFDAPAHAGIVFSTDGTVTPSFITANWGAYNINGGDKNGVAMRFTATNTGTVATLVVVAFYQSEPFPETFELFSDQNGITGSTLLDQFSIVGANFDDPELLYASSTDHPTLNAGQAYWLEALAPLGNNQYFSWNSSAVDGGVGCNFGAGSGCTQQFQVQAIGAFALFTASQSNSPEPTSMEFMGLAALGMVLWRWLGALRVLTPGRVNASELCLVAKPRDPAS